MKAFDFLPEFLQHIMVSITSLFVGEGWHLTLGALFMVIVIFLPGGLMEGFNRIRKLIARKFGNNKSDGGTPATAPAE